MGGCFGGALGSGLPVVPLRGFGELAIRLRQGTSRLLAKQLREERELLGRDVLALLAALAHLRQQQLQLPVARHERRHHREHVVGATLPQQLAHDVERRPAKLTLARRLLVLVAHGSSQNHSDDPCQRPADTIFSGFRQPVARDAGSTASRSDPACAPALRAASTVRARPISTSPSSPHPRGRET